MSLSLKDIKSKLSPEGQKWIWGMSRGERVGIETILNDIGEETFIENWLVYKEHLDEVRNF